jgi:hypothetical protein
MIVDALIDLRQLGADLRLPGFHGQQSGPRIGVRRHDRDKSREPSEILFYPFHGIFPCAWLTSAAAAGLCALSKISATFLRAESKTGSAVRAVSNDAASETPAAVALDLPTVWRIVPMPPKTTAATHPHPGNIAATGAAVTKASPVLAAAAPASARLLAAIAPLMD